MLLLIGRCVATERNNTCVSFQLSRKTVAGVSERLSFSPTAAPIRPPVLFLLTKKRQLSPWELFRQNVLAYFKPLLVHKLRLIIISQAIRIRKHL